MMVADETEERRLGILNELIVALSAPNEPIGWLADLMYVYNTLAPKRSKLWATSCEMSCSHWNQGGNEGSRDQGAALVFWLQISR